MRRDGVRRGVTFLSALDDPTDGIRNLEKLSKSTHDGQRTHRGFNLFDGEDRAVFEAIVRGEFDISGFQNRHLQDLLPDKSAGQISRVLKRLRTHGLVKKIGRTYKYYVTQLGQRVICAALTVRRLILIPALAKEILA